MKTLLKILAGLILFVLIVRMCGGTEPALSESSTVVDGANSVEEPNKEPASSAEPVISKDKLLTELEAEKIKLSAAKKNFDFEGDEFTGGGWYRHKLWNVNRTYNKTFLKANVNADGYAYLVSQYYGDDWLFHESIVAKIGDVVIVSNEVESYEEENRRDNSGGSVWEYVHFTDNRDSGILEAIGNAPEKLVKIRLKGRQYHKDYTLSKNDKQAIADCLTLSRLIKSVKEKETTLARI